MAKKMTARDIMKFPVITAKGDMYLTELIEIMCNNHITGVPVVDANGNLLGMISWRLIMNLVIMGEATDTKVEDTMTKLLETYGPTCTLDTPVEQILSRFASYRINRIIVVDDSGLNRKVLGIICRHDIISLMNNIYSENKKVKI